MPPLPLPLIDATLRGMVLAVALLLAALLLRERRSGHAPAAQAALLLCAGLVVQVLSGTPQLESGLACAAQAPLIGVAVGNAVLFWLFSAALFDDSFRWRPAHALAWAVAFAIGALQCPVVTTLAEGEPLRTVLRALLRGVPLLCVAGAVWVALRQWRADLIESRRRWRLVLVGAGVAYTLVQLAARVSTPVGTLTPGLALLDMAALLAVIGGWAWAVLRLAPDGLLAPADVAVAAQATLPAAAPANNTADRMTAPVDEALAAALQRTMSEDRAYRDPALTLAALATALGVPDYRLRRHIHQQLGFRNFNAYVNSLRLADAQRWLADPAQRDAPVLTLALDAGFGSVGPFNRAFKAATGLTPTEFRARALAESSNT